MRVRQMVQDDAHIFAQKHKYKVNQQSLSVLFLMYIKILDLQMWH